MCPCGLRVGICNAEDGTPVPTFGTLELFIYVAVGPKEATGSVFGIPGRYTENFYNRIAQIPDASGTKTHLCRWPGAHRGRAHSHQVPLRYGGA